MGYVLPSISAMLKLGKKDGLDNIPPKKTEEHWILQSTEHHSVEHPTITCDGCGAPVNENHKCRYCGRLYKPSERQDKLTFSGVAILGPTGYTGYTGYTGPTGYTGYTGSVKVSDDGVHYNEHGQELYKKYWQELHKARMNR